MFSPSEEDWRALHEDVGFSEVPLAALVVRGPDRHKFLHGLLTADLLALKPGGRAPAFYLTPKGRVVADLEVCDRGDDLLLLSRAALAPLLRQGLSKPIILTQSAIDEAPLRLSFAAGPAAARSAEGARAEGTSVFPCRLWGPGCVFVGAEPRGARRVAFEALEALRVEAGVAAVGSDTDEETFPMELNAEEAISFDKGCYLGQETTAKMRNLGHRNRTLARLAVEGAEESAPLAWKGERVGRLTGLARLPGVGVRGLALLKTAAAGAGTELSAGAGRAIVL